jgi:hypothetical protein
VFELIHQGVREDIVSGELEIAPDLGLFAQQLTDPNLKRAMKVGDPSHSSVDKAYVINVGITDEGIAIEAHSVDPRNYSRILLREPGAYESEL